MDRSEGVSGGAVSRPVVRPRLPFYGLGLGAPGAEAGYRRTLGQRKTNTSGSERSRT